MFIHLITVAAIALTGVSRAEELEFFEKKYKTKIEGVKPIGEYSDPDSYYTAIAKELGIFELAYEAVFKKYGWMRGENFSHNAMVKRGEGTGRWEFIVVQIWVDPKTKKPAVDTMQMKMVFIDDDGKASFPKPPAKGKEKGSKKDGSSKKSQSKLKAKPKKKTEPKSEKRPPAAKKLEPTNNK